MFTGFPGIWQVNTCAFIPRLRKHMPVEKVSKSMQTQKNTFPTHFQHMRVYRVSWGIPSKHMRVYEVFCQFLSKHIRVYTVFVCFAGKHIHVYSILLCFTGKHTQAFSCKCHFGFKNTRTNQKRTEPKKLSKRQVQATKQLKACKNYPTNVGWKLTC